MFDYIGPGIGMSLTSSPTCPALPTAPYWAVSIERSQPPWQAEKGVSKVYPTILKRWAPSRLIYRLMPLLLAVA